jgi:effector-binding domain-containing protein
MPKEYTLDTLPIPNDKRISITTMKSKTIAVITFSRYATQDAITTYRTKLLDWLKALNINTKGESVVAQYNDPWTPPTMRTNEIWIEIDKNSLPK